MHSHGRLSEQRVLQVSIAGLVAVRLWMMAAHPLADATEARYGELARVTADGGFWLMPHMTPTEPFWGKPPLATWLAAGSWKVIGATEFALRLPSFAMALLTVLAALAAARSLSIGKAGRTVVAAVLVTAPLFVVSAGAVMTDAAHLAAVTGAMLFAWKAITNDDARRWRLGFWAIVGIATLVKGLATVALIGVPLTAFVAFSARPFDVLRRLLDIAGLGIAVVICVSWYLPAERANPGFLYYFVVGEHLQRFLQPAWTGDRYGVPHRVPWGTIWLYWLGAIAPWIGIFLAEMWRLLRRGRERLSPEDVWLWCWLLAPLIFFTFARNIIWTYALTAIPPFALLAGRWAEREHGPLRRLVPYVTVSVTVVAAVLAFAWLPQQLEARSARQLIQLAQARRPGARIFVRDVYAFSPSFYTRGAAVRAESALQLETAMTEPNAWLIVPVEESQWLLERPAVHEVARNSRAVLMEVAAARDGR